jgi:beta-N-acetylhexosaminidase
MLGQMMVTAFPGPRPSASLLARIQDGELGGVILFSDNVVGGPLATSALTRELQSAAARGGNPPLLIMTDQEGGAADRLSGPPAMPPAEMTTAAQAFDQGVATGRLLREQGVNADLAPVADVARTPASFLGSRSFGANPQVVATLACAFARGLASQGVAYTLKHFPGLGRAGRSTDYGPVVVADAAGVLREDYLPYSRCGRGPLALVMVSSAIYPALTGSLPAVMSPETYRRELPRAVGGARPVTISDDLESGAIAGQLAPARHAVAAGLDLVLYAASEKTSADVYEVLLADARAGLIPRSVLEAASLRIRRLKRDLCRGGCPSQRS